MIAYSYSLISLWSYSKASCCSTFSHLCSVLQMIVLSFRLPVVTQPLVTCVVFYRSLSLVFVCQLLLNLCNTYASSYWQRRLHLLYRGAILRSSKWYSSFVHGHRSSLYSFIVGHCIKRYNALFMIVIHSFISLWTVARLTLKIRARLW
jgi:hypothetical protein